MKVWRARGGTVLYLRTFVPQRRYPTTCSAWVCYVAYVMSCYAMLCDVMLCHVMLCYILLCVCVCVCVCVCYVMLC